MSLYTTVTNLSLGRLRVTKNICYEMWWWYKDNALYFAILCFCIWCFSRKQYYPIWFVNMRISALICKKSSSRVLSKTGKAWPKWYPEFQTMKIKFKIFQVVGVVCLLKSGDITYIWMPAWACSTIDGLRQRVVLRHTEGFVGQNSYLVFFNVYGFQMAANTLENMI